ncbi:hypothetical protein KM043_017221 [Ampulex compressa]|nr:hypothetical protein KM043_017221 [Ampulex compressa]
MVTIKFCHLRGFSQKAPLATIKSDFLRGFSQGVGEVRELVGPISNYTRSREANKGEKRRGEEGPPGIEAPTQRVYLSGLDYDRSRQRRTHLEWALLLVPGKQRRLMPGAIVEKA